MHASAPADGATVHLVRSEVQHGGVSPWWLAIVLIERAGVCLYSSLSRNTLC